MDRLLRVRECGRAREIIEEFPLSSTGRNFDTRSSRGAQDVWVSSPMNV